MLIDRIAQRYARSVYALAAEKGQVELFLKEFKHLKALIDGSPELKRFLNNPVITAERKVSILKKVFAGRVEAVTLTLIESLARRHRAHVLPHIAREFVTIYQRANNVTPVTVRATVALTPAQREAITRQVTSVLKTQVELTEVADSAVLGGLILTVGDRRYDASLASQLRALRKQFEENLYVERI